jgi:ligand-binding SRPBCC domain-containing protein
MYRACNDSLVPDSFKADIKRVGRTKFVLRTEQTLPVPGTEAFSFFEDPRNLFEITPDWLDFRMLRPGGPSEIFEGAEFAYRIRWFGMKMLWKSRIINYCPPVRFTDIQIQGPYLRWEHTHRFESAPSGTLMTDEVRYTLPFSLIGELMHTLAIRKQLLDIFCYRAIKINAWANNRVSGQD